MPAHTFGPEWLDQLLRGDKHGTTRPQSDRIKVGDIVNIYNQQRRRIVDKPLRKTTPEGRAMIASRMVSNAYPPTPAPFDRHKPHQYYAHFLGKVEIAEVYDIQPIEMSGEELEAWAWSDGFEDFTAAESWFGDRYTMWWLCRTWTVERWHGWTARYFLADGEPQHLSSR